MERAISKAYTIKAPLSKVWAALVSPALISKWSGAKAVMQAKSATTFELWDDYYFRPIKELLE